MHFFHCCAGNGRHWLVLLVLTAHKFSLGVAGSQHHDVVTHEHSRDGALNPHTPWDKPHLDAANWREFPPTCRSTLRHFPP